MADMLQFESKDENPQQQDADQTDKHHQSAAAGATAAMKSQTLFASVY